MVLVYQVPELVVFSKPAADCLPTIIVKSVYILVVLVNLPSILQLKLAFFEALSTVFEPHLIFTYAVFLWLTGYAFHSPVHLANRA